MSHFAVLVVGGNVEEQLAPYHEFECTGDDNCYVQDVDQTEEALAEFQKAMTARYKDPEGNFHDPFTPEGDWDVRFWRELTPEEELKYGTKGLYRDHDEKEYGLRLYSADWHDGKGYRTRAFAWPSEGWSEVEVPRGTVGSFAEFCEDYYGHKVVPFGQEPDFSANHHKYGYTLVDENGEVVKTIDRTNPNKKWDWYEVGGRWNGFFKLKPLAVGLLGKPGIQTMDKGYEPPTLDRADACLKGDIDVEGMRDEAAKTAAEEYDLFARVTAGLPKHLSWDEVKEQNRTGETNKLGEFEVDYKVAREEYNSQPAVEALRKNDATAWFEADKFLVTFEQYVQRARDSALTTFAILKDGKWYERGEMGWWGIVSNEQDRDEWNAQFSRLIDGLPDSTLLSVVDCHI